ncbi:MAG: hypothetical protein F6J93_21545 [Oscillatoria sp. SIO1A7]|nr:hypothetical protein [Oscillatoria sp. SIO1A7]
MLYSSKRSAISSQQSAELLLMIALATVRVVLTSMRSAILGHCEGSIG